MSNKQSKVNELTPNSKAEFNKLLHSSENKTLIKKAFKKLWESDAEGGGITFNDIAECAKKWGLYSTPRIHDINKVMYEVLKAAGTTDCEEYNPIHFEND